MAGECPVHAWGILPRHNPANRAVAGTTDGTARHNCHQPAHTHFSLAPPCDCIAIKAHGPHTRKIIGEFHRHFSAGRDTPIGTVHNIFFHPSLLSRCTTVAGHRRGDSRLPETQSWVGGIAPVLCNNTGRKGGLSYFSAGGSTTSNLGRISENVLRKARPPSHRHIFYRTRNPPARPGSNSWHANLMYKRIVTEQCTLINPSVGLPLQALAHAGRRRHMHLS